MPAISTPLIILFIRHSRIQIKESRTDYKRMATLALVFRLFALCSTLFALNGGNLISVIVYSIIQKTAVRRDGVVGAGRIGAPVPATR